MAQRRSRFRQGKQRPRGCSSWLQQLPTCLQQVLAGLQPSCGAVHQHWPALVLHILQCQACPESGSHGRQGNGRGVLPQAVPAVADATDMVLCVLQGLSAPHIQAVRGMTKSICVSSLLANAPEAQRYIAAGGEAGIAAAG